MMLWLVWTLVILVAIVLYLVEVYSKFSKYGVKHPRIVPVLGTMGEISFRLDHMALKNDKTYSAFQNQRFVGIYDFLRPVVMIKDLELIKKITIKDFEHFTDHRIMFDKEVEPLFVRNLFFLKGQDWRDMRSTLSPAFTNSKIRLMVPFMSEVGNQMINSLRSQIKDSNNDFVDIDCKDLVTRYTNDVISSCALGLKVDSHSEKNNKFYEMGKGLATLTFSTMIKFFLYNAFPNLMKKLHIPFLPTVGKNFFGNLLNDIVEARKQNGVKRNDVVHLLMKAKKDWSNEDMYAQLILFFMAGFDTIATGMAFMLFELALNPDVQERLAEEIRRDNEENSGRFDFESIKKLTYLDMVITESLRLWPPIVSTDRMCTKRYNLGRPNEKATRDYIVEVGEGINIPIWSFHHSAEYFPEPYKFDPERFSEVNKYKIKPFTYMPFGHGLRTCIASRFSLYEMKMMLYHLLLYVKVEPCEKSPLPIELVNDTFHMQIKGGHWLRFKMRNYAEM